MPEVVRAVVPVVVLTPGWYARLKPSVPKGEAGLCLSLAQKIRSRRKKDSGRLGAPRPPMLGGASASKSQHAWRGRLLPQSWGPGGLLRRTGPSLQVMIQPQPAEGGALWALALWKGRLQPGVLTLRRLFTLV